MSAPLGGIVLYYKTSWNECYLHHSRDRGATWSKVPGVKFNKNPELPGWQVVRLDDAEELLFVPNDGGKEWDNPKNKRNYEISSSGAWVLKSGRVTPLSLEDVPRVLVVSDLDGTMIGDDPGTREFADVWFRELMLRGGRLVYNTGRSLESFLKVQEEKKLPSPAALITAVGTEIYWTDDNGIMSLDAEWADLLRKSGWNRDAVVSACDELVSQDKAHYRPADEQLDFKVVLGVRKENVDEVIDHMKTAISLGGGEAKFVYSGHGEWRFLDILSPAAGKLSAMKRVRDRLRFEDRETVACGDSGNDIAMLEGTERGIIVGNAQSELREWYQSHAPDGRIFSATQNHAYAILEGLRIMGFVVNN